MMGASPWVRAVLGVGWLACWICSPVEVAADQHEVELRELSGAKTLLSAEGVRAVGEDVQSVAIRPGEYIIAQWAEETESSTPVLTTDGEAWELPYGFIGVTRAGREVRFRPVVEHSGGLFVSSDASGFGGLIHVGLQDLSNPPEAYDLESPIDLLVSAAAEEVSPRQLAIRHTGLPFAEVSIQARAPEDSVEVAVRASGTNERATLDLPVVRPQLELSVSRGRIQGFGLETSEVVVRAVGLREPGGRVVTLTSGEGTEPVGTLDTALVKLDEQGVGSTTIRSLSRGASSVAASSPPLAPARTDITFTWPVAFVVASVLGGVVGAFLGRHQGSEKGRRRGLPRVLIVGALTGIVAVVLYAVGVNVLPVQPVATAGEALVFAVAAVAGYVGLRF